VFKVINLKTLSTGIYRIRRINGMKTLKHILHILRIPVNSRIENLKHESKFN